MHANSKLLFQSSSLTMFLRKGIGVSFWAICVTIVLSFFCRCDFLGWFQNRSCNLLSNTYDISKYCHLSVILRAQSLERYSRNRTTWWNRFFNNTYDIWWSRQTLRAVSLLVVGPLHYSNSNLLYQPEQNLEQNQGVFQFFEILSCFQLSTGYITLTVISSLGVLRLSVSFALI